MSRIFFGPNPGTIGLEPSGFAGGLGSWGGAAAGPQTYEQVILASGPVGYWRLGESSGTLVNDSGPNNLDGTYTNTPTLGAVGAIAGDSNTAMTTTGTQYASIPHNAAFNMGQEFSLECWLKTTDRANQVALTHGANSYTLQLQASTGFVILGKSHVGNILTSTAAVALSAWTHVVVTKSGAVSKIYQDGVDRTGTVTDLTIDNVTTPLELGGRSIDSAGMHGSLDEVAIYARALPAAEVLAHYNAGIGA